MFFIKTKINKRLIINKFKYSYKAKLQYEINYKR